MAMFRKVVLVFEILLVTAGISFAQSESGPDLEPSLDFGLSGLGLWNTELYTGLKGLEIIPGVESKVLFHLGGGYYSDVWYYDSDQNPLIDPEYKFPDAIYNYWQLNGKLGLDLGIAWHETLEKNWLSSLLYIKSKKRWNVEGQDGASHIMESDLPESSGLWETSIFASLGLDLISRERFLRTRQGLGAELSVEWTPGLGINRASGEADYYRLSGWVKYFQTVLKNNDVSIYLGDRFMANWLGGNRVPVWAQATVGGLYEFPATGGIVRGIAPGHYDANLKLINNLEAHILFPTVISPMIVPDFFVFFDSALTDQKDGVLNSFADGIYTVGGGLYLDFGFALPGLFDWTMIDIGYYITYSIQEEHWNFFNLAFSLHF